MALQLTIETSDGQARDEAIGLSRVYNFGYAGRSRANVAAHVEELRELGFIAPERTPSIYPIAPNLLCVGDSVTVRGADTYGEAEFAMVMGERGWYVGVASDHSDMVIEQVSTARAKTLYPDVVSEKFWAFDDVLAHWDEIVLRGERRDERGWALIQEDTMAALMRPEDLISELEQRSGEASSVGTAFVSGTIAGEILPGATAWRNTLVDPVLGRTLRLEYQVLEDPLEI